MKSSNWLFTSGNKILFFYITVIYNLRALANNLNIYKIAVMQL